MNTRTCQLWGWLTLAAVISINVSNLASAATHYVDLNSTNATPPFTDWSTAATNIQDAIDASSYGDQIWVTNGIYQTGGKPVSGVTTFNRVALDKPVMVASASGPAVTFIQGIVTGRSPVRCVYLTNGAVLAGFTLTNGVASTEQVQGAAGLGGGVYCQSAAARLTNCVLTGNVASSGGGAYQGTLDNCILQSNSASLGGGAYQAILNNCGIVCNTAVSGGATAFGTLNNCTLTGNSASSMGGGSTNSTLNNCLVYYNNAPVASNYSAGILNYCCTTPLPAGGTGNFTTDPQLSSTFHLSISSPCRGAGNPANANGTDIDGEAWATPPSIGCDEYWSGSVTGQLSVSIAASYTNVTAGFAVTLTGTIMGKATASVWDFGDGVQVSNLPFASHAWAGGGNYQVVLTAYNEDHPGGVSATQAVQVAAQKIFYVAQSSSNPIAPYADWTTAAQDIQSAVDLAVLPGQSVLVFNGLYQTGGRPYGTTTTNRVTIPRAMRVSSVNGPTVTFIQGQHGSGGGLGPTAVRCVYVGHGAVLDGFTLTNGATGASDSGGGVYGAGMDAVVMNCVLTRDYAYLGGAAITCTLNNCQLWGNSAYGYGGATYYCNLNNCTVGPNSATVNGGGVCYGTLNNCILTNNLTEGNGGGSYYSMLNNCILWWNDAEYGAGAYYGSLTNCTLARNGAWTTGGGAYQSKLYNCIVYSNYATTALNYSGGSLNYCCTTPNPGSGVGNITNVPGLVDAFGGDFHLQPTSPCINAGNNNYVTTTNDLDGNPRIVGGTVDIGAYEYQMPSSALSYAWAQQYGLPTDGTADYADTDGTGMNNWQKWIAGLNPTNPASVLVMQTPVATNTTAGVTVSWQSVNTRTYYLQRATDFTAQPAFTSIKSNLLGQAGTTSYTDITATNAGPYFYRVGVQ